MPKIGLTDILASVEMKEVMSAKIEELVVSCGVFNVVVSECDDGGREEEEEVEEDC